MSGDRAGHAVPSMPTIGQRLLRAFLIMLAFVLIGPPVGGFVFMPVAAMVGMGAQIDMSALIVMAAFGLIYAVPLSYFVGAIPAALVGALTGAWLAFRGRMPLLVAAVLGVVAGLALVGIPDRLPPFMEEGDAQALPVLAACLAATLASWAFVRNWDLVPFTAARRPA